MHLNLKGQWIASLHTDEELRLSRIKPVKRKKSQNTNELKSCILKANRNHDSGGVALIEIFETQEKYFLSEVMEKISMN